MAKYDALGEYLKKSGVHHLQMTFREVESVIGHKLPSSAFRHRPWWANEARGHSHAKAWLAAGYQTEQVDMAAKKLVFKRVSDMRLSPGVAEEPKMFEAKDKKSEVHPLIGWMKGTFTIEPGWDLAKPALDADEWSAWEAKLDRMADELQEKLSEKPE